MEEKSDFGNLKKTMVEMRVLTLPNVMSFGRIVLIPFIMWFYISKKNYTLSLILLVISALTDVVDGIIARHFNMVSEFGKALDPVADKLTQGSLMVCLSVRYRLMRSLLLLFLIKELFMLIVTSVTLKKKGIISSAKWYGKANTVILEGVIIALILFPSMPIELAETLICICFVTVILSFVLYLNYYLGLLGFRIGKKS
ncbi:MAG: CDP-alcohol phosphatidyltransferase family protein [Firmicutes bacterium]|nr:CDP-alcohol phosphatidyltransferase family protein [Candidatus Colimorpha enterica]